MSNVLNQSIKAAMMTSRFKETLALWRNVMSLLRRAAPALSLAVTLVTLVEAIVGLLVLYMIKLLVDSISVELSSGNGFGSSELIWVLVVTGLVFLCAALFQSVASILRMRQGMFVSDYVDKEIHNRAIAVGLEYYESPEYYDALERAREGGTRRPAQIVANSVVTFRASITIAGIFVLIGSIEYRLVPVLIVPIIVALVVRLHFARKLFDWRMSRAQKERRAGYLDWVMTHALHAKDLRINHIGPFFRNQYSELRRELRNNEIAIEQTRLMSEFLMAVIGALVFIAATSWLLFQSLDLSRPIGDVVLFVLLLRRAETSGKELVGNISKIVDDHLYLKRLFDFLSVPLQSAQPRTPKDIPEKLDSGLQLSNVSFRYNGSNSDAIRNVSIRVDPGQVVALVGENGSGKTTLIKLLTRLYDPTEGCVTLDGTDVREFDPQEFRKDISVVFQDYVAYAETAYENIRYGDITREHSQDLISAAAEKAGAAQFIQALPYSYQTPLTKLFDDGHDLSIGQWQRLALARALYPKSRFLILDEPTSAMDPKAEFELFENFKSRIDGKGALIISHRLSTIRQADYIYLMSDGKILEQGTHDQLIATGGRYSELFAKQADLYK